MPRTDPSNVRETRSENIRATPRGKNQKKAVNIQDGAHPTRPSSSGIPTAAVASLELRLASTRRHRQRVQIVDLLVCAAKAPTPTLIFQQSLKKSLSRKSGQRVGVT